MASLHDEESAAYRAIGRYVAEFSLLVATMRDDLVAQLTDDPQRQALARLALGTLTAQQVADAFFAAWRTVGGFDSEELRIEKCLRLQVDEEIRQRNIIAHGDWLVTGTIGGEEHESVAALVRVKPSRIDDPSLRKISRNRRSTTVGGRCTYLSRW